MMRWVIGILGLLALCGLIFAVTTAFADEKPLTTAAEWLSWPTLQRSAFVLGAASTATDVGAMDCPSGRTFAELIVAVQAYAEKEPEENVLTLIGRSMRNMGCTYHPRPEPAPVPAPKPAPSRSRSS